MQTQRTLPKIITGILIVLTNAALMILHFSSTMPKTTTVVKQVMDTQKGVSSSLALSSSNEVQNSYYEYLTIEGRRELQTLLHETLNTIVFRKVKIEKLEVGLEGNSAQLQEESADYLKLAIQYQPNVICEIGFNAGHSAATFLVGSNGGLYQGFDIWQHSYNKDCFEVIQKYFGKRVLGVEVGDSTKTVPSFISQHPEFRCDLIHVDGGHFGEVPMKDLINMRALAHKDTIVVMDDLACTDLPEGSGCIDPMKAWRELQEKGLLEEMACNSYGQTRGMCWGKYLRLNNGTKSN